LHRDELPGPHCHRGTEPEPDLLEGGRAVVADDGPEHVTGLLHDLAIDDHIIRPALARREAELVARLGFALVVLAVRVSVVLRHHVLQSLTALAITVNGYQMGPKKANTRRYAACGGLSVGCGPEGLRRMGAWSGPVMACRTGAPRASPTSTANHALPTARDRRGRPETTARARRPGQGARTPPRPGTMCEADHSPPTSRDALPP